MKQAILLFIILLLSSIFLQKANAQETLKLTLQDAIRLGQENSPQAIAARHAFRSAYWEWRTHKANLLPSLIFTSEPELNRSISAITQNDGTDDFKRRNQLSIDGGLTINQNIPLTGGSVFINTSLQRIDLFNENKYSYKSTPVIIGYEQNLFGYNKLKWDKKIEPIRYREAKKNLIETLELVSANVTYYFFLLVQAQTSLETASYNYANADTLYQFAKGRYNIGTITENEMLQLELNLLTEQTNIMNARINLEDYTLYLRSYLGISGDLNLFAIVNDQIPQFTVSVEDALIYAYENNPEPEIIKRKQLESESLVAQAKANRGFKADLYVRFGLSQTDEKLSRIYRDPLDQQLVSVGISIPILDWGVGKGRVKVAMSNRDKVYTESKQEQNDFELNVIKTIKQFNLQSERVNIAGKADETAQRRNEVARRLYLLGQSSILDLNAAIAEKDNARSSYINSLYKYWELYYAIRSITGYDFEKNKVLTEDYELLMQ